MDDKNCQLAMHEPLLSTVGLSHHRDQVRSHIASAQVAQAEDTPAYETLQAYELLNKSYRKEHFDEIFTQGLDLIPSSSRSHTWMKRFKWGVVWTPGCGWVLYSCLNTEVTVPPGHVCCFIDGENNYLFAKPGIHNIFSPFLKKVGNPIAVQNSITHGNRTIVTVPQGKLGIAQDMGHPVLLPPGLHSWTSETLQFERIVSLDENVIVVGPYTLLTVDEGYAAITQNNGMQVVLSGGQTHLLTHQKWRFEKFITLKIQTDDLQRIQAASADNVLMEVNSTVVWRISSVQLAAMMGAETMSVSSGKEVAADITKLRRDVLKQAIASLASFIGSVNYSDSFHVAAAAQRNKDTTTAVVGVEDSGTDAGGTGHEGTMVVARSSTDNPMFDSEGMSEAVAHANQITCKFGVEILGINIISANPVDPQLTASLATGAVASAEALQAETAARGRAKAMKIEAEAHAIKLKIDADSQSMATLVKAQADGEAKILRADGAKKAEILRAEGSKQAAELLESSKIAVTLETLKASAAAIQKSDKFFFGQEPAYMPNIFMRATSSAMENATFDDAEAEEEDELFVSNTRGSFSHVLA